MRRETATPVSLGAARWLRLPLAGAAALLCLLVLGWHAHASPLHRAALVIEHGSGHLLTRCVSFVEDQISGLQLIQRAGVQYQAQQYGSLGSAICQLDDEPAQVPAGCFGSGPYWQYFHRTSGGWFQSSVGASSWMPHDGDMDGWHYASGADQAPVNISFSSVCGAVSPSATVATTSHEPLVTSTSARKSAAQPSATAIAPSAAVTATATATLEALVPTASPRANVALTQTGPSKSASPSGPLGVWVIAGGIAALLVALGMINYLRHGP